MDARTTYEGQKTFNFYLVALDFSILGLAVKEALQDPPPIAELLQVAAWICLFVSGLFALSYVEWSSKMMDLNAIAEKLLEHGQGKPDYVARLEQQYVDLQTSLERRWVNDRTKYAIAKWGFLVGVLLLAGSRIHAQLLRHLA